MSKAIDIVANELIAVATPGEGFCLNFMLDSVVFSLPHLILDPASDMFFPPFVTVDEVQLDRAKQSTKSAILVNVESRVCNHFIAFLLF